MGQKFYVVKAKGKIYRNVASVRFAGKWCMVRFAGSDREYQFWADGVEILQTPDQDSGDVPEPAKEVKADPKPAKKTKTAMTPLSSVSAKHWKSLRAYLADYCHRERTAAGSDSLSWEMAEENLRKINNWRAENSALEPILSGQLPKPDSKESGVKVPFFPFGCNESQMKAVKTAMESKISVIQGPPGTGKTQTILNIIANLVCAGRTVAVVSNNNEATRNVCEKLGKSEWDLRWIVAELGKEENRERFFAKPPLRKTINASEEPRGLEKRVEKNAKKLSERYERKMENQERISDIRELRFQYDSFLSDREQSGCNIEKDPAFRVLRMKSSKKLVRIERRARDFTESRPGIGRFFIKMLLALDGVPDAGRLITDPERMLDAITAARIEATLGEWDKKKSKDEDFLSKTEKLEETLSKDSRQLFLWKMYRHFAKTNTVDRKWDIRTYRKKDSTFFKRYPVVTSTAYALPRCAPSGGFFDYVVMDEASQINLPTAFACFAYARRVVIVGDSKQLPAILSDNGLAPTNLWDTKALDASKMNVLDSVLTLLKGKVPETLLREHYRCHPDIIGFCNRMFYDGQLIPMTQAKAGDIPFEWIRDDSPSRMNRSAEGKIGKINPKQANTVAATVQDLLNQKIPADKIGVVVPYAPQKMLLRDMLPGVKVDTVHGFQGGEKDVIVFAAVTHRATQFIEDPNLLNVAVSRAKDKFVLVSPAFSEGDCLLGSLVRYIDLLSPEKRLIRESPFRSIFDMLFDASKLNGLVRKEGESPSEAIFRGLAVDVLKNTEELSRWDFTQEYPLRLLPQNLNDFTVDERRFMRNGSRLDFLFYHKITKEPLAVVEVDGYSFHKEGTRQAERDALKDSVLKKIGIGLLRLSTQGDTGQERERLKAFLLEVHAARNAPAAALRKRKLNVPSGQDCP